MSGAWTALGLRRLWLEKGVGMFPAFVRLRGLAPVYGVEALEARPAARFVPRWPRGRPLAHPDLGDRPLPLGGCCCPGMQGGSRWCGARGAGERRGYTAWGGGAGRPGFWPWPPW